MVGVQPNLWKNESDQATPVALYDETNDTKKLQNLLTETLMLWSNSLSQGEKI
jgi:hypothetical protein